MGNRLAKPPPFERSGGAGKNRNNQMPRQFPALSPQSYLPGGAGIGIGNIPGGRGLTPFPTLGPNSYLPPPGGSLDPPVLNYNNMSGMLPRPNSLPSLAAPSLAPSFQMGCQYGYPNQNSMMMMPQRQSQPHMCDPGFNSLSRRPVRISHRRRSRRCRPVIHVIDSDSCSSISSCESWSSCSRRRRRTRSCSRRRGSTPQQQQPIIVLPIQCQQPAGASSGTPMIGPPQTQQIVLPPLHVQQGGQLSQQGGLSSIQIPSLGKSTIAQGLNLPQLQFNTSSMIPNLGTNSVFLSNGQSLIQQSPSIPQIANIGQIQTVPANTIQYVQAAPQTSSPLQYVTNQKSSSGTPSHVLVNSTNKKTTSIMKPVKRASSINKVPQSDLKYGRRPFDWYKNSDKNNILNENIQIATQ